MCTDCRLTLSQGDLPPPCIPPSMHTPSLQRPDPPPPPCGQTNTCENITFPCTSYTVGNKHSRWKTTDSDIYRTRYRCRCVNGSLKITFRKRFTAVHNVTSLELRIPILSRYFCVSYCYVREPKKPSCMFSWGRQSRGMFGRSLFH